MSVNNLQCHPERRAQQEGEGPLWPANRASSEFLAAHLREVRDGRALSADIACRLLRCDDEVLPDLLATARALKEQYRPGVVTYSRKVFIPLTNARRSSFGGAARRKAGLH
jgi:FO synthase